MNNTSAASAWCASRTSKEAGYSGSRPRLRWSDNRALPLRLREESCKRIGFASLLAGGRPSHRNLARIQIRVIGRTLFLPIPKLPENNGAAFVVAGPTLWYKAIFLFPLAAMLLAFAVAYPSISRRSLTAPNIALAVICMAVGMAPLIAFNGERRGGADRKAQRQRVRAGL